MISKIETNDWNGNPTMNTENEHPHDADPEVGDDLEITEVTRRAAGGGAWVAGHLNGHRFGALVFPEHAANPDWEVGDSRISKLRLKRLSDGKTVANFDRGWDVGPIDATAQTIIDFLAAGLAEHVYG